MRIFVIGAEGQVARALREAGAADPRLVVGYGGRPELDLTRPETLLPALEAFGPDLVVNAAAYTAVDKAEAEPELAFAINRDGAGAAAAAADRVGAPIIHLSTDYVFDGSKDGLYAETDPVGPQSVYGCSKLAGEQAVAELNSRHVILRTAWVYAPFGANFVRTMLRLAGERDLLRVVDDQVGCPTYAPDIAKTILDIASRIGATGWREEYGGVTHVAGPDAVSWCEFARAIMAGLAARGGRAVPVEAITTAHYPTPAKRPANSRLSTARLAEVFDVKLPPLATSLGLCLDRLTGVEISKVPERAYGDLQGVDDVAVAVPAHQRALAGNHEKIVQLADELSRTRSERDCATARLAELEGALAHLTSERSGALSALLAAEAECAGLRRRGEALSATQSVSRELSTELRKVLREPWRPLAQRCLYLLFSTLGFAAPGAAGQFFSRQAKQRTPRRLEALVRDVDAGMDRAAALEAEVHQRSPSDEDVSPVDLKRRILVADSRTPRPEGSPEARATFGVIEDLCALGYQVTFLSTDLPPSGRSEEDLRRLGVQVVAQPSAHGGGADFVERVGPQFGVFYLIGAEAAQVVLPVARRVAPDARVIFQARDVRALAEGQGSDEPSRRRAAETYQGELAMMSASDHVVVGGASELAAFRPLLPNTPMSVFPSPQAPVAAAPRGFQERRARAALLATLNDARALLVGGLIRYCQNAETGAVPAPDVDVDVSIIVPAYNKWELTRACLTSVLQTCAGSDIRFEVILADDNSTDDTVRAGELFPGLRIARTPENLGFLRNCNHAARMAHGRFLLLLNNDTVVLPGWLEALFRPMERDPAIGITGSKLLYPDLTIQEAGGAIFRDASARNVGRGQRRDHPLFNAEREVDYISGASILVRADFWRDVGGFDERFKTAYCEDSDLAMTARAKGLTVWYQPKSEVIHFEHQSYSDQEGARPSDLMLHNSALFFEKWKDVLLRDHAQANHDPWLIPTAARNRALGVLKTVA